MRTRTKNSDRPQKVTESIDNVAVSVVIPTHNPRMDYLARVIEALKRQALPCEQWELLIVDNASRENVEGRVDIGWHQNARMVREDKLGLTYARLRGLAEAKGELIVMVDDDNVLAPDYLANAVSIAEQHQEVGAFGGKCLPEFEVEPEPWMEEFLPLLALRDHGDEVVISGDVRAADGSRRAYPDRAAPIGAGMVLRREAAAAYAARIDQESKRPKDQKPLTDRRGDSLASAGDNDLVFQVLREGWKVGYFPQLVVTHLIPAGRLSVDYLARANRGIQHSWVEVLRKHDACPWSVVAGWSAPIRKLRAFWNYRGWQKPGGFIRWQGACGQFEGRVRS